VEKQSKNGTQNIFSWLEKKLKEKIFGTITLRIQNGKVHTIDFHRTLKPEELDSDK